MGASFTSSKESIKSGAIKTQMPSKTSILT
jgi:hypothetical protein